MAARKWLFATLAGGVLAIGGFLAAAFVASPPKSGPIAPPLPVLDIDPREVTLAGNSSGGFMALQAGVVHSATFRGVAALGAGPFYCSEGSFVSSLRCYGKTTTGVPVERLIKAAGDMAAQGKIDPVSHIAAQKIYIFRGTLDAVIPAEVALATVDFYERFASPGNIRFNFSVPVAHGWVSPYGTNSCLNETENFVNNCGRFDAPREFLSHFYGKLNPKKEMPLTGKLLEFDQNEFFDDKDADAHSADEIGFAYIPQTCIGRSGCRAIVVLHGCEQDYGKIDRLFVTQSGVNQWADTNRIVVVYPQVKASNGKLNPRGCWDWFGYNGKDFATNAGHQVRMLKRIVDRLTGSERPAARG